MDTTLEREPAAAGLFYPADAEALREAIERCFEAARDVVYASVSMERAA